MTRCEWCVGFIRRDCTIMERCVQTGMRRPRDRDGAEGGDAKAAPVPNGTAKPGPEGDRP